MSDPRILHISYFDTLGPGHSRQLIAEHAASARLEGISWKTVAVTTGRVDMPWAHRVPTLFRFPQGGKLFFWLSIARRARSYDAILVRHTIPDPFAPLLAPLVRNLYTVHHTKETEEIDALLTGAKRAVLGWWERHIVPLGYRRAAGVIGVTGEIGRYEADRFGSARPPYVYPNAFEFDGVLTGDRRSDDELSIVFTASSFEPWHGLDRLLDSIAMAPDLARPLRVHLVGRIPPKLAERIAHMRTRSRERVIFHEHGTLTSEEIHELYTSAHVGVASLALDRNGLSEASTLKVREYLATGVPVYSTHIDSALPDDFPFYHIDERVDVGNLVDFALSVASIPRDEVSIAARRHLGKAEAMTALVSSLFAPPAKI